MWLEALYKICSKLAIRPTMLVPNTHCRRRRDATVELCRVGVRGVYWALNSSIAAMFG